MSYRCREEPGGGGGGGQRRNSLSPGRADRHLRRGRDQPSDQARRASPTNSKPASSRENDVARAPVASSPTAGGQDSPIDEAILETMYDSSGLDDDSVVSRVSARDPAVLPGMAQRAALDISDASSVIASPPVDGGHLSEVDTDNDMGPGPSSDESDLVITGFRPVMHTASSHSAGGVSLDSPIDEDDVQSPRESPALSPGHISISDGDNVHFNVSDHASGEEEPTDIHVTEQQQLALLNKISEGLQLVDNRAARYRREIREFVRHSSKQMAQAVIRKLDELESRDPRRHIRDDGNEDVDYEHGWV